MPLSPEFSPSTRHADLGSEFFDPVQPADFPRHELRLRNDRWARRIGLGGLTDAEWLDHFGRFEPLPGSFETPLALRYHGHQFRVYNPDLGDGRGFLFAQARDLSDGRLLDLATKGSGQTPWSRQGDGRLTLKGGVREALATAMLEARGVDTSKTFSLVGTGESLFRGDEPSPTRSAVLTRLSHSHIRIGTFQRLLFLDSKDEIVRLIDHVIATYMPDLQSASLEDRAVALIEETCRRVARTGAGWMMAGFVHGVLNTDNINVTGESFDYGPWRFLPTLDPTFTAAYFDHGGLYAYGRQPDTLLWNLTRLAECLLDIAPQSRLEGALRGFEPVFRAAFDAALLRRLGLSSRGEAADGRIVGAFWTFLKDSRAPFEQTFFDWRGGLSSRKRAEDGPSAALYAAESFGPVEAALEGYDPAPWSNLDHPYFAGARPCDMLIEEVEAIWAPIAETDDWSAFETKLAEIEVARQAYEGDV